ncbi:MAG: DUF6156 family protein [Xanthobacteraceae bacterium]|nr:DUF6156 family protein [Xanthobacteraceae bacterium]
MADERDIMRDPSALDCRYFVSYRGVSLPAIPVSALDPSMLTNRNTYIRAFFDDTGVLHGFDKLVYGAVELSHRYAYHANGRLSRAEIAIPDEEPALLAFDETGRRIALE